MGDKTFENHSIFRFQSCFVSHYHSFEQTQLKEYNFFAHLRVFFNVPLYLCFKIRTFECFVRTYLLNEFLDGQQYYIGTGMDGIQYFALLDIYNFV